MTKGWVTVSGESLLSIPNYRAITNPNIQHKVRETGEGSERLVLAALQEVGRKVCIVIVLQHQQPQYPSSERGTSQLKEEEIRRDAIVLAKPQQDLGLGKSRSLWTLLLEQHQVTRLMASTASISVLPDSFIAQVQAHHEAKYLRDSEGTVWEKEHKDLGPALATGRKNSVHLQVIFRLPKEYCPHSETI